MRLRVPSAALEGSLYVLTAFGPFAFGGVEPWSVAVLEAMAFLLALGCFLRGREAADNVGAAAWLLPAAVAVLGGLQSLNPVDPAGPHFPGLRTVDVNATHHAVLLWSAYAAVLFAVPRTLVSPQSAKRFCWFIFALGLATVALGFAQAATSTDMIYWFRPTLHDVNPFAAYYNIDHAANLLLMCLAVGLGLFVSRATRWKPVDGPLPGEIYGLIWMAGGLAGLFSAIVVCHSRGALLAMPLSAAALVFAGAGFARTDARRRLIAAAALGAVGLIVYLTFAHVTVGGAVGARMDRSVSSRLLLYADGWQMLRDAPYFGTGLGTFSAVFPAYQDETIRAVVAHAHSDWLEFALDAGIMPSAAALAALVFLAGYCVRVWRRARSREMRALIGGGLAAAAAFAAHSLFDFSFQIPANAFVFFAIFGFLLSAPAWSDKTSKAPVSAAPDAAPAAAALACAAAAVWASLLPAAAAWSAARPTSPSAHVGLLARALDFDDDPAYRREMSRALEGLSRPAGDVLLTRSSLGYALEATRLRPYDARALYSAGLALWKLKRPEDAQEFLERERRVSYSDYFARHLAAPDEDKSRLEMLRELKLLPPALEKR
jgi:O-antigen ligase